MKVKELINELSKWNPGAEVVLNIGLDEIGTVYAVETDEHNLPSQTNRIIIRGDPL